MKHPKNYYPALAAATLAIGGFIPAGFGDEQKSAPAPVAVQAVLQDSVVARIDQEIILPLNHQAKRRSMFSRRMPTSSTSYHLVESTDDPSALERQFKVILKTTPYAKGGKMESTEFLKLRYLEKTGTLLVRHENDWVTAANHPFLKLLPKAKPAPKITP